MTDKKTTIEQLYQELVSQDPSLANHKKEIIWLLTRMESNVPEIVQDPMFFWNLKNKLRYHLITRHEPAPTPNLWQKFLLYGFPTLAIGVALVYILPILPFSQSNIENEKMQPTMRQMDTEIINKITHEWSSKDITMDRQDTPTTTRATTLQLPTQEDTQLNTTTTPPSSESQKISDSILSHDQTESVESKSSVMPASADMMMYKQNIPSYTQTLKLNNLTTDYTISYDKNGNLIIDALIMIKWCEVSYTLHNPISLSRWPNLWHVTAVPMSSPDSTSYDLILTIINKEIITIEWYEQLCQK